MNKGFQLELCRACVIAMDAGTNPPKWAPDTWQLTPAGEVYYFAWSDCDGCGSIVGGQRLPVVAEKVTQ